MEITPKLPSFVLSRGGVVELGPALACGWNPAPSPVALLSSRCLCPGSWASVCLFLWISWKRFKKQNFSFPSTRIGEWELINGKSWYGRSYLFGKCSFKFYKKKKVSKEIELFFVLIEWSKRIILPVVFKKISKSLTGLQLWDSAGMGTWIATCRMTSRIFQTKNTNFR